MYQKVKSIFFKFLDNIFKIGLIFWVILFVLSIISFFIEQKWPEVFTYPEGAYQALETEATKMAETHNLETDYVCTYEYNNETRRLSLKLTDSINNDRNIYITATISNYKLANQDITIKRYDDSKRQFIVINLLSYFVILPLLGAFFLLVLTFIILLLLLFVVFISHKIREKIQN